jgi:MSHA biogenesis protein MshN
VVRATVPPTPAAIKAELAVASGLESARSKAMPAAMPGASQPPAMLAATPTPEPQSARPALTKDIQVLTPPQQAENLFRKAILSLEQGNTAAAQVALEQALQHDPRHAAARQTLAGLLLDAKRAPAAIDLLQAGLKLDPAQAGMAMILARIQVEKGEIGAALDSLQRSLPYAAERADYQAFMAALLQRQNRHTEAIEHYRQALRKAPENGLWWMGVGISLRAAARPGEARDAFERAAASNALSPQLRAFVEQQAQQLRADEH